IKILFDKLQTITSPVQTKNMDKTNVIYGSETKVLDGSEYITDELLGKKFNIRARSFYQVNHGQTEKLYKEALKIVDLKGDETIIDTYCGIGTIGQVAADHVKKIIGKIGRAHV